jgi:hypothetical protein
LRTRLTDDFWLVLLWRGATWCYLAYLALIVAARRARNWRLLGLAAVPLGNQIMVLVANPAQLYRYMAAGLLVGMLLIPVCAIARRPRTDEALVPAPEPAPEPEPAPA